MRLSRRGWIVASLVALCVVASVAFAFSKSENGRDPQQAGSWTNAPNILIIITDDQRAGTLDGMPAVKRLFKKRGVTFPNAFVTTPVCCPSRVSIMTGSYVHNHGVKYFTPYELNQRLTVQYHLSRTGYMTAFFGKYLNGWRIEDDPPYFDQWATFPQSTRLAYAGGRWNVDGTVRTVGRYSTRFIESRSLRFLRHTEETDDTPWLMFGSVPAAHEPFLSERRYRRAPVGKWLGNPAVVADVTGKAPYISERTSKSCDLSCGRRIRAGQYRVLLSVDDLVSRLFTELDRLGESADTLAFFVSDNGSNWGEYGLSGKRYPYTPSVRVPLLMRWPAELAPGKDPRLVANIDIAPTILDAARVDGPSRPGADGNSLLRDWRRRRLLLEHWGVSQVPRWASIRTKRYQYVEYFARGRPRVPKWREYYDLRADPWQLNNLLDSHADEPGPSERRLARLHRLLAQDRRCAGRGCP